LLAPLSLDLSHFRSVTINHPLVVLHVRHATVLQEASALLA